MSMFLSMERDSFIYSTSKQKKNFLDGSTMITAVIDIESIKGETIGTNFSEMRC